MAIEKLPEQREGVSINGGNMVVDGDTYKTRHSKLEAEKAARQKAMGITPVRSYSHKIAEELCLRVSQGRSLQSICFDPDMPNLHTVWGWIFKGRQGNPQYTHLVEAIDEAKQHGTDAVMEDIFAIADDGHNDWMEKNYGGQQAWVVNGEAVQRSKLRVEARMWYMSKLNPKKYGDKIDVTSGGEKLPTPLYGGASIRPEIVEGQVVQKKKPKAIEGESKA